MPVAVIMLKYCLPMRSFSRVNRLGDILMGGPFVLMKHSTPWRDVLDTSEASMTSWNSWRRRVSGEGACTTLTPEMELEVDERRVATPKWTNWPQHRSIVILKFCKKSNPNIGLETWAIKKTNEYDLPPIFICLRCVRKAFIGVLFAAVNPIRDKFSFEVVGGGRLEGNLRPGLQQAFSTRDVVDDKSQLGGGGVVGGPAALGNQPTCFPKLCWCGSPCGERSSHLRWRTRSRVQPCRKSGAVPRLRTRGPGQDERLGRSEVRWQSGARHQMNWRLPWRCGCDRGQAGEAGAKLTTALPREPREWPRSST